MNVANVVVVAFQKDSVIVKVQLFQIVLVNVVAVQYLVVVIMPVTQQQ